MTKKLLKHQYEFITSSEQFVLLAGGLGSGKSTAGAWFVINESLTDPRPKGLICANTYRQLRNATLATLFRECDENGIDYSLNENKGWLRIEDAFWYCYSLDNPDNVRGVEVGKIWNDETRDTSAEAFHVLTGRLRDKSGINGLKARYTSTPFGFNYLYDYFVGDKKTKQHRLIHAPSSANKHLPPEYLESMKNSFDSKIYAQEVLAEFVNVTSGRIYYAFERSRHIKTVSYDSRYPIYVGMDFNINPMTATMCQHIDGKIKVYDEIWLSDSNTEEMAALLLERYGRNLTIIPDATGKALKTSGFGLSDHEILRRRGFKVEGTGNPFRMDRYNNMNGLFEREQIEISDKCAKLIRDLEQVTYKEKTTLPETNDASLTHISDALGYFCWYANPLFKKKHSVQMLQR
jgi:PBSX family phage terminase large subunit